MLLELGKPYKHDVAHPHAGIRSARTTPRPVLSSSASNSGTSLTSRQTHRPPTSRRMPVDAASNCQRPARSPGSPTATAHASESCAR
eukprot:8831350-Alexandrium_andersonii.AAC.1